MVSQKKLERREQRKREFKKAQGPCAVRHDRRTWAENNGGVPINPGEAALLKQWPGAEDIADARRMSAIEARRLKEE